MRTEDGYLIAQCLNGEKSTSVFLVEKYKESVYDFAWDMLHNFHDAEDITQEVFIKAYRKLHTLKRWDNFLWWISVRERKNLTLEPFRYTITPII